jgi:hypothetical protein
LQARSNMAAAASQAQAAQDTVGLLYSRYRLEVESLSAHLDWVGWMLDALAVASFQLSAGEYGIAAVEAVWERPGLEAEAGILYLTGQRLLWEDRVGTYELKVNLPLGLVEDVCRETGQEPSTGDPLDWLIFRFAGGAPLANARFQLSLPVADEWLKMCGRARSGGYEGDLAIKLDPTELERIRNAPVQCTGCGAAFTVPILRGQMEIACDYCGVRTRF